jgi:hypothetical protein
LHETVRERLAVECDATRDRVVAGPTRLRTARR